MPTNEPTIKPLPEGTFQLPIGFTEPNGTVHKTFSLKPMTGRVEEAMSDKKIRTNMGAIVTALIHGVIEMDSLGRKFTKLDAKGLKNPDRDFIIYQNYLNSIGETAEWQEKCPACGEIHNLSVDMSGLEVTYLEDNDPQEFKVTLPHGVEDSEGKLHKELTLSIPDGFAQELFIKELQENPARAVSTLMSQTTENIEGMASWNVDHFRDLSKKDRNIVQKAFTQIEAGVNFDVATECPHCSHEYGTQVPINQLMGE